MGVGLDRYPDYLCTLEHTVTLDSLSFIERTQTMGWKHWQAGP